MLLQMNANRTERLSTCQLYNNLLVITVHSQLPGLAGYKLTNVSTNGKTGRQEGVQNKREKNLGQHLKLILGKFLLLREAFCQNAQC